MAQILLKNDSTPGRVPTHLAQGEIGINTTDGKIYYSDGAANNIKQFGVSSSYALTASYALNGGGGGDPFPYTGSALITGSLAITGLLSNGILTIASGSYSHAEGTGTQARGDSSHTEGFYTIASGSYSHAEGYSTKAIGEYSHAEGGITVAQKFGSHAEGYQTIALGPYSHAEGEGTIASGSVSHAEGRYTTSSGNYSHAEGGITHADGDFSHAEGYNTVALGYGSHAEGSGSIARGIASHAEGLQTVTSGSYSHAEGATTTAKGIGSHAEGYNTMAAGDYSHAEGYFAYALETNSHVEGNGTVAGYRTSLIDEYTTPTSAPNYASQVQQSGSSNVGFLPNGTSVIVVADDFAYLSSDIVSSSYNAATNVTTIYFQNYNQGNYVGYLIRNIGNDVAHAEGLGTVAQGVGSHAEGYNTVALGYGSHTEGSGTTAVGEGSHAEGTHTTASGSYSHAEGFNTIAQGNSSHVEGYATQTGVYGFLCLSIIGGVFTIDTSYGDLTDIISIGSYLYYNDSNYNGDYGITYFKILAIDFDGDNTFGTVENNIDAGYGCVGDINTVRQWQNYGGNIPVDALYSHAEGVETITVGDVSHAEGNNTKAFGNYSHAEGYLTKALVDHSHAEGYNTVALGYGSHTEGNSTTATGNYSHAEGFETIAITNYSHAEGNLTFSAGVNSHTEGQQTVTGYRSPLFDYDTDISGQISYVGDLTSYFSIGSSVIIVNDDFSVIGEYILNSISFSGGFTYFTFSTYTNSYVGYLISKTYTTYSAHAEGVATVAQGIGSHAEGLGNLASGYASHAEGIYTTALGDGAHTEGLGTIASGSYQHVQGQYNISSSAQSAFIHGNGTSNVNKSNLIFASGSQVQITGSLKVTGSYYLNNNKLFNYGQFLSTETQSGSANTAYAMKFNTTDATSGVTVANNASGLSTRITVANTGIYNLQFSSQLGNTANSIIDFDIWFAYTGSNVANSNTQVTLNKVAGSVGRLVAAWNFMTPIQANDYIEIIWSCTAATGRIEAQGTQTGPTRPAIPSVIATLTQIA